MTEPTPLIEIIEGNYLDAFKASVPETLHTSAEVQAKRVEFSEKKDNRLKDNRLNHWFYTANTPLYGMDGKTVVHFLGGRDAFLRLYAPHVDDVYAQILKGRGVYVLPPEDAQWAKSDGISLGALPQFDLKNLIDIKANDEWGYYTINTAKPDKLKGEKRAHAELVHGESDAFYAAMEMLAQEGVSKTMVCLLVPKFVKASCTENAQIVGRGARLDGLSLNSDFDGDACGLSAHSAFLGVRREVVAEALPPQSHERSDSSDAPKNEEVHEAPSIGSSVIQLNPEMAAGYLINTDNRIEVLAKLRREHALGLQDLVGELLKEQ